MMAYTRVIMNEKLKANPVRILEPFPQQHLA